MTFYRISSFPINPEQRQFISRVTQVTAHEIFESLACLSETFVFMFMGMGFFTGRFTQWDTTFVPFAILFCLVGRAFNTFPISALANVTRAVKIPARMQFVIWFAGLRGAIAFALSQNMPGPVTRAVFNMPVRWGVGGSWFRRDMR